MHTFKQFKFQSPSEQFTTIFAPDFFITLTDLFISLRSINSKFVFFLYLFKICSTWLLSLPHIKTVWPLLIKSTVAILPCFPVAPTTQKSYFFIFYFKMVLGGIGPPLPRCKRGVLPLD